MTAGKMTQGQNDRTDGNQPYHEKAKFIVGIGASAGGLDALTPLVSRIESCGHAAYIIARHMSPDHGSRLAEILSGYSALTVITASDEMALLADTIYVVPPGYDAEVEDDRILLKSPSPEFHSVPSVDILFASIARSRGENSVGIILSGAGSDGTKGAGAIKNAGGLVIAQKPNEAINQGMPDSAIEAGFVDFQLNAYEIGDFLNSLGEKAALSGVCEDTSQDDDIFLEIVEMVAKTTNMDVTQYKEATLRRQIKKRILSIGIKKMADYLGHLKNNPEELTILQHSFLISVTSFFRDSEAFSSLEKIMTDLVSEKQPGDSIRIWVPGCATGEEAYSMSILLNEVLGSRVSSFDIRIFATDIDAEAIAIARTGVYPASALENMNPVRKEAFFTNEGRNFKVKKAVRDICIFSIHDVICHPPFIRMDIVSCRNLLIYLKPALQDSLMSNFHYALNPDGYLLLGKSESTGYPSRLFDSVDLANKLFKRKASVVSYPVRISGRSTYIAPVARPAIQSKIKASPFIELTRDILVTEYAPSSVLVNNAFEVIHFFGNARRYLSLPTGSADFSLFSLCLPEISGEMKTLCYRASHDGASKICGLPTPVCIDGQNVMLQLTLRRLQIDQCRDEYSLLISFDEYPVNDSSSEILTKKSAEISTAASDEITRLRHELAETREHLQAVVEALEASNEELQSLNEEQQASSEELQSSNEELQSSNEELTTLNDELRVKSMELANLNSILSNVQDSMQMGLVVVDRNGKITRFNALAVRVFGLMKTDIGQHIAGIPCRLDLPNLREQIAYVIYYGTCIIEKSKHGIYHYLMQISPSLNESGQCIGAILTFTDISALQRAEEALRESQKQAEFLASMLENSSQPFAQGYADGRLGIFNKAFLDLTGYTRDELYSINWANDLTAYEWLRIEMEKIKELNETGMPVRYNKEYIRKDGSIVPVELFVHLVRDDSGQPLYYYSFITDITERQKAEDAIRKSEELLKSIINNANGIIWVKDLDGRFLIINRYAENRFGLIKDEIIGKTVFDLFPDNLAREYEANEKQVLELGHALTFEESARIDGTDHTFLSIKFPLIDQDGNIYALGAICTDITDHLNLVDERNKLHDQFTQSQKLEAVGRLAGGVAHDFNNMLAAITGFAELAMHKSGNDMHLKKDLSEILKAASRSADLVQQLMAFARKQNVLPMVLDINHTLSGMLKMIGRLIGEDIELVWKPGKKIWQIKMDPSQIDHIIANLAINARDAISGNGRIIIETENAELDSKFCSKLPDISPGDYVILTFSDNGQGMDKETVSNIFEPFYTTKEFGHGTGLGLATVYGIVRQNSGAITVHSEEGHGTTFRLYFPRFIPESTKTTCVRSTEVIQGHGETILLVEDEKAILNVGKMMLEKIGYKVLTANTPTEAITIAESCKRRFDLLITDVIMPEMNGKELSSKISEIQPSIKILFMSGYTANIIANRGAIDNGLNFIHKPFSLSELAAKVHEALSEE
ncbi:chemotaxis protein CheB [Desulforegula conservatrix]|uniref:chemotaxis protein CheB n=1 Tax=Desulforegula conservatrix TaxID=153026 RepID=UPI000414CA9A|nr:chemotaxis protein CheB [Desulforegula conservatrix]